MKLEIGMLAPDFRLKNQDEAEIALKDLLSKNVVLYFYPKDNTSGCSLEAQDFSELLGEFAKKGAIVVGVSPDSAKSHKNFIEKKSLKHILLSDPLRSVATSYGVYAKKMMYGKEVMGIVRSTFVIGTDGKIKNIFYNVRAKGHAKEVLDSL